MHTIDFEIPAFMLSLLCLVYCLTAKIIKKKKVQIPENA